MGEVAEQVGQYVTAFSSDLKDESLDGQRVVIGGIVTGFRRVITKANATMGVATLEDLQGSIEVVVFPKMYETDRATWTEGAILLVAGRIDHRGEEVSLLADLAVEWDDAVTRGPEAFAREVAAGDRGRGGRRGGGPGGGRAATGTATATAGRVASAGRCRSGQSRRPRRPRRPRPDCRRSPPSQSRSWRRRPRSRPLRSARAAGPVAVGPGFAADRPARPDEIRPGVPRVSPLRAGFGRGGCGRRGGQPAADRPGRADPHLRRARGLRAARRRPSGLAEADHRAGPPRRGACPGRPGLAGTDVPDREPARPGPPRPLRRRDDRSARPRDGDVQDAAPRAARWHPGRPPRAGPDRAADRCRWSSAGGSPTTPSCCPRSAAGSARASST